MARNEKKEKKTIYTSVVEGVGQAAAATSLDAEAEERPLAMV